MPEQTYRGTHRHRAPLGWHPPRMHPESPNGDADLDPQTEPTAPFTPAFTGTPFGSNAAHNNVPNAVLGTWYIKL